MCVYVERRGGGGYGIKRSETREDNEEKRAKNGNSALTEGRSSFAISPDQPGINWLLSVPRIVVLRLLLRLNMSIVA